MKCQTHTSKTLHQSRNPHSVLSVVCVHDFHCIGNESTTEVLTSQKVVAQKFFIVGLFNLDFFLCTTATFLLGTATRRTNFKKVTFSVSFEPIILKCRVTSSQPIVSNEKPQSHPQEKNSCKVILMNLL